MGWKFKFYIFFPANPSVFLKRNANDFFPLWRARPAQEVSSFFEFSKKLHGFLCITQLHSTITVEVSQLMNFSVLFEMHALKFHIKRYEKYPQYCSAVLSTQHRGVTPSAQLWIRNKTTNATNELIRNTMQWQYALLLPM